jgi:hypothetical protein
MTRFNQILLAAAAAVALSGSVASAAVMDDHAAGAERAPDVNIVILNPNGKKNREADYLLSQPATYHAEATSAIAKAPALAAELRARNVEMNNVLGVHTWSNGSYTVYLR